jgi:tetratricopeptide (TPR) repeat protein
VSASCRVAGCFLFVFLCAVAGARAQAPTRAEALALEQSGQNEAAERAWDQLRQANPADAEPPAHMGLMESRQQKYEAAATMYKQALSLDPGYPGLEMNLGLAYFKSGDFPDAAKVFREELRKQPGDQRLTTLVAMAHFAMSDYFVAVPYFMQAVSDDPQNLAVQLALAQSCLWSRQYECVLDVQKKIRGMNAESAEADMLAAQALDATGESAGAMDQLRAAITANPTLPTVHFALGFMLWKEKQFAAAAREFDAELNNGPHQTQTLAYLGNSYLALGEYQKAEASLDAAAVQDASSEMVHLNLGILFARTGRKDEAAAEFQQAIRLNQYDRSPRLQLERLHPSAGSGEAETTEAAAANAATDSSDESLMQMLSELQPAHS